MSTYLYSISYQGHQGSWHYNDNDVYNNEFSYLFEYIDKKRWISGPMPPKTVSFLHSSAIGINKTAVIFLRASPVVFGANFNYDHQSEHKLNYIYNFDSQSWVRIIDLPDEMAFKSYNLPLTITFDKNSTTYL